MATKPKSPRATPAARAATAEDLARKAKDKAINDTHTARVMTSGQCNALVVQKYLHFVNDGSNIQALAEVCTEQTRAIGSGDFGSLEYMLLSQAQAMQAMFINLATLAKQQDRFDGIQTMTTLALKCAAQSRQAITALAELRMPKTVMFAKQANVTSGPQQVNNGVAAPAPAPTNGQDGKTIANSGSQASLSEAVQPTLNDNPNRIALNDSIVPR